MSSSPLIPQLLPVPIDLSGYLTNYYIVRSCQSNLTHNQVLHVPQLRPALHEVAACNHYFTLLAPPGITLISVFISLHPAFDFNPQVFAKTSSRFKGPAVYIIGQTPPSYLPQLISDYCFQLETVHSDLDTGEFLATIIKFIKDFFQPVSPPISPQHIGYTELHQ